VAPGVGHTQVSTAQLAPPLARRAIIAALVVYGVSIPLVNLSYIPEPIRLAAFNTRPRAFVALIIIAVLIFATGKPRPIVRFHRHGLSNAAAVGLSFPIAYAAIRFTKGNPPVDVVILHGVWVVSTFIVMPLLIQTRQTLVTVIRAIALASGIGLAAVVLLADSGGLADTAAVTPFASARKSYGFYNPNYFAQIPQVLAACCAYLLAARELRTRAGRALAWASIVGSFFLVSDARSRNVLAFFFVTILAYVLLRRRLVLVVGLTLLLGIAIWLVFVAPLDGEVNARLDSISSSRVTLWQQTVSGAFAGENVVTAVLGGPQQRPTLELTVNTYDPLASVKAYNRYQVDNTYLGLFVEAGLLGLLWFVVPYVLIARRLSKSRLPEAQVVVAVLAGVAAQGIFAATVPTIGSPLGFLMLLWMVAIPLVVLETDQGGFATLTPAPEPPNSP
jgi:hypothetical protein